jgi:uncharacterized protein YprB with RNaseH-like and TPR domain
VETVLFSPLKSSFQIFPGIGEKKEKRLYSLGLRTWDDLLIYVRSNDDPQLPGIESIEERWNDLTKAYLEKKFIYFTDILPSVELWRLWSEYAEKFCFLDIETTGICANSVTTVVSTYQNSTLRTFERGKDLEFLCESITEDSILVTYNGKRFDIPFLEREFHFKFKNPHLDLMNLLHSLGIKGGLKKSEELLGLTRPNHLQGMEGKDAPILWQKYQKYHDLEALQTLISYNQEDTKNLETVLERAISRLELRF